MGNGLLMVMARNVSELIVYIWRSLDSRLSRRSLSYLVLTNQKSKKLWNEGGKKTNSLMDNGPCAHTTMQVTGVAKLCKKVDNVLIHRRPSFEVRSQRCQLFDAAKCSWTAK